MKGLFVVKRVRRTSIKGAKRNTNIGATRANPLLNSRNHFRIHGLRRRLRVRGSCKDGQSRAKHTTKSEEGEKARESNTKFHRRASCLKASAVATHKKNGPKLESLGPSGVAGTKIGGASARRFLLVVRIRAGRRPLLQQGASGTARWLSSCSFLDR